MQGSAGGEHPAVWLFAAASLTSLVVLAAMAPQLTFVLDDWEILQLRVDPSWHAVMAPHNEHISIAPVLIYEALLHSFGMESSTPFRIVATLAFLAGVVLLFIWVRRRVGDWLALAGTLPLLFFGAGAEDLLFPFQIGYFGSLGFGIAALLALERDDRLGDRLACGALVAGLTFSSVGLPFLVAGAVCVGWDRRRWRRAYVVVVPAALYALWWLGWGSEADSHLAASSVATSASYILDGFGSSLASLLGLGAAREDVEISALDWGRPLLVAAVALAILRLIRGPRPSRWLWIVLALTLAYWFLAAASAYFDARAPTVGRYQYVGAVFLVMLGAELLRGVSLRPAAIGAVFAAVAIALAGNLATLIDTYRSLRSTSEIVRADLTALELARGLVPPEFQITGDNGGTEFVGVQARFYFPAIDEVGSPAYSEDELRAAPEHARSSADKVSAAALGLDSEPVVRPAAPSGPQPNLVGPPGATARPEAACLRVEPSRSGEAVLSLPRGGAVVSAGRRSGAALALRRFATESFPIAAGEVGAGDSTELRIPVDAAAATVAARGGVTGSGDRLRARIGFRMSVAIRQRPALALFAVALVASATMLVVFATQLTFLLDDWAFLQYRADPSWHAVMAPHNEHISIAPVLIYEALLHSFGMESSTPFRIVATLAFLAGVVLLFIWVRRRVGDWLALAGTLPLLFFGAGAEDLLFPFQIGYFGSLGFGIAALLALERDDRLGDRLACGALGRRADVLERRAAVSGRRRRLRGLGPAPMAPSLRGRRPGGALRPLVAGVGQRGGEPSDAAQHRHEPDLHPGRSRLEPVVAHRPRVGPNGRADLRARLGPSAAGRRRRARDPAPDPRPAPVALAVDRARADARLLVLGGRERLLRRPRPDRWPLPVRRRDPRPDARRGAAPRRAAIAGAGGRGDRLRRGVAGREPQPDADRLRDEEGDLGARAGRPRGARAGARCRRAGIPNHRAERRHRVRGRDCAATSCRSPIDSGRPPTRPTSSRARRRRRGSRPTRCSRAPWG